MRPLNEIENSLLKFNVNWICKQAQHTSTNFTTSLSGSKRVRLANSLWKTIAALIKAWAWKAMCPNFTSLYFRFLLSIIPVL